MSVGGFKTVTSLSSLLLSLISNCQVNLVFLKVLHCDILKKGLESKVDVGSAITYMYAKCGRLDIAYEFFRGMFEKDSVCWNSMISSFSRNGKPEMAIDLFRQMGTIGAKFDSVTRNSICSLCCCKFNSTIL